MSLARNKQYKKNIIFTTVLQGTASLADYIIIPLAIAYAGQTQYGLWLVINSIFAWLIILDLGLGNGLRNKLAVLLAKGESELSKKYISSTYFFITILGLAFLAGFIIAHQFIEWGSLLNAPRDLNEILNSTILICAVIITFRFILTLINSILNADQNIGLTKIFIFGSNILTLIIIFLLKKFGQPSFLLLCLSFLLPQLLILFSMNIHFFNNRYRSIRPSIFKIRLNLGRGLINLGIKFFIQQFIMLIVLATDNIVITKLFGPQEVTPYNIALQYMLLGASLFNVILAPSWSAYTEAEALKDFEWIKTTLRRFIKYWFLLAALLLILFIVSEPAYRLWIGNEIIIPEYLTLLMALFAAQNSWNKIFTNYLNGIGKISLLARLNIISGISNIPLSIYFAKGLSMGVEGVILATIVCSSLVTFCAPLQTYLIIKDKARGIWDK